MSVLYESGTSIVNQSGLSRGIGFSNDGDLNPDGFGIAHTSSSGISQTLIAKKCAPPEKPNELAIIVCLAGLAIILPCLLWQSASLSEGEKMSTFSMLFYVCGTLLIIAATAFAYKKDVEAKKLHKQGRIKWKNSWVCLRCGQAWTYQ